MRSTADFGNFPTLDDLWMDVSKVLFLSSYDDGSTVSINLDDISLKISLIPRLKSVCGTLDRMIVS
jgi:hypothetical protein